MNRILIIGQAPSRTSDPSEPLSGNSGRRLAALCELSHEDFLRRFERINLSNEWLGKAGKGDVVLTPREAREIAGRLRSAAVGRRIVLLGRSVATAFEVPTKPILTFRLYHDAVHAVCPHPSGVNRWWNLPGCEERARRFWTHLASAPDP